MQGPRESPAPAPALASRLRVQGRREKREQRVVPASDTPAIKESAGLRDLLGAPALLDLQRRWYDLGTDLLCSRCLEPLGRRDHRGRRGHRDPQELMESLVIQERMEKLVLLGLVVSQEVQDLPVQKARRVSMERVSQDLEAPLVPQDLLDLAPVTTRRSSTWRARDSPTWTKSGVPRAPQVLQALPGLQWHWDPTVQ